MVANLLASSATMVSSMVKSGFISTVTEWSLLTKYLVNKSLNTGLPASRSAFNPAKAASNRTPSTAGLSKIQLLIIPSMRARPLGKPPVLNSLNLNSRVFKAALISSFSKPLTASSANVALTKTSTFSAFSGLTPFNPTPKVLCNNSSDKPPPVTLSPSCDSVKVFLNDDEEVPNSKLSSIPNASISLASKGWSFNNQLTVTICLISDPGPIGKPFSIFLCFKFLGWNLI
mmetsp:Transcript_5114/g.5245  ORF Transcript_5114/g.5245 Transcript_5114/m.5245 type:complete len:230 (-) Transcript_5114:986-1675(-)